MTFLPAESAGTGKTETATPEKAKALVTEIRKSPLAFFRTVLGAEPTPEQVPILQAFSNPSTRRVAVKSGHSCGKDWIAARLALWFFCSHDPCIVVCTGPTERQVRHIVWGELETAYRRALVPIGGELTATMLRHDLSHYIIGYTAADPSAFTGFHSNNVLVIVTEAQGIESRMWAAVESLLTAKNAKLLLIGNAIYEPESEFYAAFTSRAAQYERFTLDSEKSPHCSPLLIQEWRDAYGLESPVYQARVKGEFPTDLTDTLIPLGWIEKAFERWSIPSSGGEDVISLGVDVARFGTDETVFVEGRWNRFRVVNVKQGQDLMQTCGQIVAWLRETRAPAENVRIDDTGMGGGVTDRLREQGFKVTAINFGSKAADEEKWENARSELFMSLRDRFRTGDISIDPAEKKTLRDLSVLRYKQTSKGRIALEPKAEAKRRMGYSPDRADALALAAIPQGVAQHIGSGLKSNWGLLEYMRQQAAKIDDEEADPLSIPSEKPKPISVRPAAELPGAQELLRISSDGNTTTRSATGLGW